MPCFFAAAGVTARTAPPCCQNTVHNEPAPPSTLSPPHYKLQTAAMTTTPGTVASDSELRAMCERLLVRENGEPWAGDAAKLRSAQLQKLRAYLETEELQPTYENVLCAASIQA